MVIILLCNIFFKLNYVQREQQWQQQQQQQQVNCPNWPRTRALTTSQPVAIDRTWTRTKAIDNPRQVELPPAPQQTWPGGALILGTDNCKWWPLSFGDEWTLTLFIDIPPHVWPQQTSECQTSKWPPESEMLIEVIGSWESIKQLEWNI